MYRNILGMCLKRNQVLKYNKNCARFSRVRALYYPPPVSKFKFGDNISL